MKVYQLLKMVVLLIFGVMALNCAESNLQPSNFRMNGNSAANNPPTNVVISNTTNSERKKKEEKETVSRPNIGITLSDEAQEISDLLDDGKYSAANVLFEDYIPRKRNDAGLYCQYLRYALSFDSIDGDTLLNSSPLVSPSSSTVAADYGTSTLSIKTAQLAVEFAPETKSWVADTIFRERFNKAKRLADKGEGFIQYENTKLFDVCFKAITIDSETAKNWISQYEELLPIFIKNGKASSAMWTANLIGDMKSGAIEHGQCFKEATKILRQSIEFSKIPNDKASDALILYSRVFNRQINEANQKNDSEYQKLLRAIETSKLIKAIEVNLNLDVYDRQSRISKIKTLPGLVAETTGNTSP